MVVAFLFFVILVGSAELTKVAIAAAAFTLIYGIRSYLVKGFEIISIFPQLFTELFIVVKRTYVPMAILKAAISEELDERFRAKVLEKFGFRRGALSEALVEALENWLGLDFEPDSPIIDSQKLLDEYPGRYLAIRDGAIIINESSLKGLWDKMPDDEDKITMITPRIHENKGLRRQLGWQMKRL